MSYQGDFAPGSLVVFNFNTISFSDGSPITLAGVPSLSVYKNSPTQSTSGASLSVDYDSVTGLHHVTIDTSADGAFYAAGNDFSVVLAAGTVGGTSVAGRVVGEFSLNNRSPLRPTIAGRTFDVSATGEGGVDWANVGSPATPVNLSATTIGTITSYTGNTPQTGDSFARIGVTGSGLTSLAPSSTALSVLTWTDGLASSIGSASIVVATNLDATVSSRAPASTAISSAVWTNSLATNLGTLASHDPGSTLASTTNITAAGGVVLSSAGANAAADALLGRNIAGGSSAGRTVKEALFVLRNKVTTIGGTLTVYSTDDTTSSWTATLSEDAAANPIVSIDPA